MKQAASFSRGMLSAVAAIILFSVIIVGCKKEEIYSKPDPKIELEKYQKVLSNLKFKIESLSPSVGKNPLSIKQILSEERAESLMQPLIAQSEKLLESFDLLKEVKSNQEYTDRGIIALAMLIYERERRILSSGEKYSQSQGEIQQKVATITSREIGDCLATAFGLSAGFAAIYHVSTKMTIKGLMTFALAVIGRSLSWVGWAFTAYNLANCLMEENAD